MAVNTRWERPDGRRYLNVTAPLFVEWRGERIRASEWSLGGLRIAGGAAAPPPPDSIDTLQLTLPFQGFEVRFPVSARVIASDALSGTVSVEFIDLGEREHSLMCHFLDELVRGSMSTVADTIQRIDVPVSPLSLEPDGAAAASSIMKRPKRIANAGMMAGVYALLGLVVFGYLGLIAYANLFRFEIDSATLSIPSDGVVALGEGHVIWSDYRPGDSVKAGEVLVRIYDNHLEREIELAEISVREREAKLTLLQRRAGDEPQRLATAATSQSQSIARTRLEIDSLRARMQAAEQEVKRISALPRIALGALRVDEARKRVLAYQKAVEGKQIELKSRLDKETASPGRPAGQQTETMREMTPLEAQVIQAEQDLEFTQQRHLALIGHRERLAARAPFDGVLTDLPRGDRAGVRKGDLVASIEQRALPTVTAFLSPVDVVRVGMGDQARLYVPSAGTFLGARVIHIDRLATGSRETERNPTIRRAMLRSPADAWSRIELHIDQPEQMSDRTSYPSGLPVVVQFQRRWASALSAAVRERSAVALAAVRNHVAPGRGDGLVSRAEARP